MSYYKNEEQQVQFLKDLVEINKDTKILDLGYGQGTHLTKLQELSDFVYGFDKDLNDKKSPVLPNTQKLNFFEQDWDLQDLDLIYCFAPEFGQDWHNFDQLAVKVAHSLKKEGKFVLDLFDWNSISVGVSFQEWKLAPKLLSLSKYTREEKAVICKIKMLKPDFEIAREVEIYWRVFEREELIEILKKAGLKLVRECWNFEINQDASWQSQTRRRRLVVVFEK
jgi:SAM-dependent methyltransferase